MGLFLSSQQLLLEVILSVLGLLRWVGLLLREDPLQFVELSRVGLSFFFWLAVRACFRAGDRSFSGLASRGPGMAVVGSFVRLGGLLTPVCMCLVCHVL